MNFFRNNSKEYDGPAANAPSYCRRESLNSSSGQVSRSVKCNGSSSRRSEDSKNTTKSNSVDSFISSEKCSKRSQRTDHSKSTKIIDRSRPLAPGISSKRTHIPIEHHISADCMSVKTHSKTTIIQQKEQQQNVIPAISGMHHDGGITCLLPLSSSQFLSGGVDGTIQLWRVPQPITTVAPTEKECIIPQWIRIYRGHTGYIHQLARLGVDTKRRVELFVSASQDNTLRIWELNNSDPNSDGSYYTAGNTSASYRNNTTKALKNGRKLRGHIFGGVVSHQGVLCVCRVPSLTPCGELCFDDTASQFASGGSDGIIRIWDVRTALSLDKVPKSGMYSTVQIQCLEKEKMLALDERDSDGESVIDEDGEDVPKRSGKKRQVDPVTALVCTGNSMDTVSLFAADSKGTIRRYSPKNIHSIGHNYSIWWEFTGYFSGSAPVSSLTSLNSPHLSNLVCSDGSRKGDTTVLASASSGCIRVWDGSDVLMKKKLVASDTHNSFVEQKMTRDALWTIELNEDEENEYEEKSSATNKPSLIKNRINVTSLGSCQGHRLIAGSDDGKIHLWDLSSGEYEGSYEFGHNIQIWSLAVISEVEYEVGDEVISVSVFVSGDNRGRLRVLKNVSSQYMESSSLGGDDH